LIDYHSSPVGHTGLIQRKTGAFDAYPNPVELLEIRIILETATRFRVQILQHEKDRYQVPFPKLPDPPAVQPELMDYEISVVKDPFALRVLRKSGGEVLFDTSASGFSFYDQFIEISSFLPSRFIYGLGEHSDRLLHPTDYTRFVSLIIL
jgi:N-terminal barrel of NtMGAM and CtMGAM, maltase-glucoamylase